MRALLDKCVGLLGRGVHPTAISDAMGKACEKACEILEGMSDPVDLEDRESLIQAATTGVSTGTKVVAQYSNLLSPIAVDCVLRVLDGERPNMVDLRDVRIVKKVGGTMDDTELVDGIVFDQKPSKAAGGPTKVENAKIGLIQFCISPPKTDLENNVIVSDYTQMDKILREERNHIIGIIKKIKAAGATFSWCKSPSSSRRGDGFGASLLGQG